MDKLLKALVAILLVLAIVALALGSKLYGKRELLKARAQKLENAVIAMGAAIEAEPAAAVSRPDYPARDLSPCADEVLASPELSSFWADYDPSLEPQEHKMLDLKALRPQLMSYYLTDSVTGKPMLDGMGRPISTGEGTMQSVLDDILAKAGDQYGRLNKTRQQLTSVRSELVEVIKEINARKKELREALKNITDLKASIDPLKKEISTLGDRIEMLEEEKETLNSELLEQKGELAAIQEKLGDKDIEIERLKKESDELRKGGGIAPRQDAATPEAAEEGGSFVLPAMPTGSKGRVMLVREDWKFVILELSDEFLKELAEHKIEGRVPGLELMVKRPGKTERFVTKIKLTHVKADQKLGVADIMADWQQDEVEEGDVVFH
jgi:peptidoglycan hydrolase CwlO-like protein